MTKYISLFVFYFIIISIVFKCTAIFEEGKSDCFCQLKGVIDDCSCNVDTVDHFNNMKIFPRLRSLLIKDYFTFYKVNLKQKCPFWHDDSRCAMRHCHVEKCLEENIPPGLIHQDQEHQIEEPIIKYLEGHQNCDENNEDYDKELSFLNTTISQANMEGFELWRAHDDALEDAFCEFNDDDPDAEYVDLSLNPERYTGYRGQSAHRIWNSIYMENCFRPKKAFGSYIQAAIMKNMCLEKRAFYRVISGLHSSINIHLCAKYLLSDKNSMGLVSPEGQWGPNLEEFQKRFDPQRTNDEGPQWLKNLYFIYLLELRALAKASPYLLAEDYYTGSREEDNEVRLAINDLINVVRSFPEHFNESSMFSGGRQAIKLKEEFRQHFLNISRIMDCVGCDKCKLWGKLQIHGLGTALKILFSGKFDKVAQDVLVLDRKQFQLKRNEIVALFNAFGRLSTSIFELEQFRKKLRNPNISFKPST